MLNIQYLLPLDNKESNTYTICIDLISYIEKCINLLSDRNTYEIINYYKTLLHNLQTIAKEILEFWNEKKYLPRKLNKFELTQTDTILALFMD